MPTLTPLTTAPRVPFNLDGRILYTSDRYEMVHLTLQPGETMEPHVQPMDIVFFVIEGTGTLTVGTPPGASRHTVPANTAVHVPAGVARAWGNGGDGVFRVIVNKIKG